MKRWRGHVHITYASMDCKHTGRKPGEQHRDTEKRTLGLVGTKNWLLWEDKENRRRRRRRRGGSGGSVSRELGLGQREFRVSLH
jgi:ribosomal protein S14